MNPTPGEVINLLVDAGATVATCESLTGGMICAELTSVPGSSQVVLGGMITYATTLKTTLAGIDSGLIETHGVVSREVGVAMAESASEICGADYGIGVTGVAGPGPLDGIEAGTVWVGVKGPQGCVGELLHEQGDREAVRTAVVGHALWLLSMIIQQGRAE
ncbi:MAG: CinA family protein [Propionibacteriaceae bacterium]|jgi:nicotinamide-nucleotide amidase|nr:CinA family protein [Propionibacteriaceae bacterium]